MTDIALQNQINELLINNPKQRHIYFLGDSTLFNQHAVISFYNSTSILDQINDILNEIFVIWLQKKKKIIKWKFSVSSAWKYFLTWVKSKQFQTRNFADLRQDKKNQENFILYIFLQKFSWLFAWFSQILNFWCDPEFLRI